MVVVFPGAVGAEEAKDLTALHGKRDVLDTYDRPIMFGEPVYLDDTVRSCLRKP